MKGILNLLTSRGNIEILNHLRNQPINPRELAKVVGMEETQVSKRLRAMEKAGLLKGTWTRIGKKNVKLYSLDLERIEVAFEVGGLKLSLRGKDGSRARRVAEHYSFDIPPAGEVVGRGEELDLLNSKEKNFFVVVGLPGIGKTSLASKFAAELEAKVFWHSLKEVDSFNYVLGKLAVFLGRFGYRGLLEGISYKADESAKFALLAEGLNKAEYALIFDDYQKCRDVKIYSLLQYLQENLKRGKVLLLSRVMPKIPSRSSRAAVVELQGLGFEGTRELLREKGIAPEHAAEVQRKLSGHPLSITLFCEFAREKTSEELNAVLSKLEADYFSKEIYNHLSTGEQALLASMAVFRTPVPVKAIKSVFGGKGIYSLLHRLEEKSLAKRVGYEYVLHELIKECCYLLIDAPEEFHEKAASYYLSVGASNAVLEGLYHLIKADKIEDALCILREEVHEEKYCFAEDGYASPLVSILGEMDEDKLDSKGLCCVCCVKGKALAVLAKWEEAEKLLSKALEIGRKTGDQRITACVIKHIGEYHYWKGELEETEREYLKALELFRGSADTSSVARIYFELARLYFSKGELRESLSYTELGEELLKTAG